MFIEEFDRADLLPPGNEPEFSERLRQMEARHGIDGTRATSVETALPPSPAPGTALMVIDARLQELAKVPGIDKERRTLGEKLMSGGLMVSLGGLVTAPILITIFPNPVTAPAFIVWGVLAAAGAIPTGFVTAFIGVCGVKSKADKRHLALQGERKQLLLEQSTELRRQQQAAEQKQREEEAEKYRQRCERLKTAAEEKLASLTDEDRHQGFIDDLSDPDEPSNIIKLGITEVSTYRKDGQKIERLTARLYQPVSSGELLKAPEIEGVGPIHSERPAPKSRFAPPLLLPRPPVKPSPANETSKLG